MPHYVILINYTEEGIRDIKNLPERLKQVEERVKQGGGKFVDWYLTMGQYDAIAIAEMPDDETAARGVLAQAAQGRVRTTTLRAFTRSEAEAIVRSLP